MKRTPLSRVGVLGLSSFQRLGARKSKLKAKQLAVTKQDKEFWDRLASEVGCVACLKDGHFNNYVSIHHVDGRTKPGCHSLVLPLCAGHHQKGTGEDKSMVAVHPDKARFEKLYGTQYELMAYAKQILGVA